MNDWDLFCQCRSDPTFPAHCGPPSTQPPLRVCREVTPPLPHLLPIVWGEILYSSLTKASIWLQH
jgi:hypothetical protein